jgi:3-hydroxyacyl-CoA dehydrogenase/enoyl-CoA hydratase/3-hydroxybutyryl-CoA epimerase
MAHAFCRALGKTPLFLKDGSAGFLVNAGLSAYLMEAEAIRREGTPITVIDEAIRESVLPMGPFELSDFVGLDVASGMLEEMRGAGEITGEPPLMFVLRDLGYYGVKSGSGFYHYEGGKKTGPWNGLNALCDFGTGSGTVLPKEVIVQRCMKALTAKAQDLLDRGIVASEEECDLGFVLGIGFAMHLGGPIWYGKHAK